MPEDRIRILTGGHLLGPFRKALGESGRLELSGGAAGEGNRTRALVWAAWAICQEDPEAVLVSLHADHAIHPVEAFLSLIREGAALARETRPCSRRRPSHPA